MPDIFNPTTAISRDLGFNPNWDYKSPRKTPSNEVIQRPRWSHWYSRSVGSAGYSFELTFAARQIEQVLYIKSFYEQYKRGFFALIDYANSSREHVGRFSSYVDDTQNAHLNYMVRVLFEEIPGCPMNNYPTNWARESHMEYVADGWLNATVYSYSAATIGWPVELTPAAATAGLSATNPANLELYAAATAAGDFAMLEYVGWGFQMYLRSANNLGICDIYLDGVKIAAGVDVSASTVTTLNGPAVTMPTGGGMLLSMPNVMLGRHQLQIVSTGAFGGSSTACGIVFPAVQVMH